MATVDLQPFIVRIAMAAPVFTAADVRNALQAKGIVIAESDLAAAIVDAGCELVGLPGHTVHYSMPAVDAYQKREAAMRVMRCSVAALEQALRAIDTLDSVDPDETLHARDLIQGTLVAQRQYLAGVTSLPTAD